MNKIYYPAIFHPEDVGYSVSMPDFEKIGCGCFTEGESLEEAIEMAFDAIGLCVEEIIENKSEVPQPSKPEMIIKQSNDFVVPIEFDLQKYLTKHTRLIKKTLTIPEWLNNRAEEQNINFSKVLRDALIGELGISQQ